jgi:hypothetical protein
MFTPVNGRPQGAFFIGVALCVFIMRLLACGNFAAQSGEKIMALQLYDQITIAGHFLPALIYGDTSGLSVPDCKCLIHWAVENPKLAAGVFDVPTVNRTLRPIRLPDWAPTVMTSIYTWMKIGRGANNVC